MNGPLQQRKQFAWLSCAFTALVLWGSPVQAQPSGGPYGPLQQHYEVPQARPTSITSPPTERPTPRGRASKQPTTLETAIERVVTGDAIILRGGIYRTGGLKFNQGITLQPYAGERPVLKGTRGRDRSGRRCANKVWRTSWTTPVSGRARSAGGSATARACGRRCTGSTTTWCSSTARLLKSAGWEGELDAHSFYIDYENGHVYIGVDPDQPARRDHRLRQRAGPHDRRRSTARQRTTRAR